MANGFDFSGIWHSAYRYVNKLEPTGNVSEHDLKIYRTGKQIVLQSIPNPEGSYFVARLTLDDDLRILTGTFEEETSPTGTYKGQDYYGACQLLIDPNGNAMHGKVVLYNLEMQIITGDWELTRTDKETS